MIYNTEYTILGKITKALADLFKDWAKMRDGDYLCLVLKSDTGAIFTTLRKDNAENREKYMEWMGDMQVPAYWRKFEIIIKEG